MIIDSYYEKGVTFVGIVHNVSPELDASSRSAVLTAIDHGKRLRQLPNIISQYQNAVLYIDPYNAKLSTSDGNEELLLRVPIHQIEAVSYLWADKQHTIVIKFGGADTFDRDDSLRRELLYLAVLCLESRETAEELCASVEQYFQTAYTEATMTYFDRTVREGAGEGAVGGAFSDTSSLSTSRNFLDVYPAAVPKGARHSLGAERSLSPNPISQSIAERSTNLGFLSRSMSNLVVTSTLSSGSNYSSSMSRSRVCSGGELSTAATDLIREYMSKLQHKLSMSELQSFASLIKAWQGNMSVNTFCEKVLDLYGPERKHLLADMKPFIPAKDHDYFQHFLEKHVYTDDFRNGTDDFEIVNLPVPRTRTRAKLGQLRSPWQTDSVDQDGYIDSPGVNTSRQLGMRESISMRPEDSSSDSS